MSIQVDSCHWSGVSREQWCWVARSRSVGHGAFVQRTLDFLVMHPSRQQSDCIHRQYDSDGKELACNAGSWSSTLGLGRSPGEGNGNPPQYSCLENSMDRGAWQVTIQGGRKSWTWLSNWACMQGQYLQHIAGRWKINLVIIKNSLNKFFPKASGSKEEALDIYIYIFL